MSGRTRTARLEDALAFLSMAEELLAVAEDSAVAGRWRAAALNAVHSAIACGDAVCVLRLELRSAGESHAEAVQLLATTGAPGAREKARQLETILEVKSRVEYEARPPGRGEAEVILKRARRLFEWAAGVVRAEPR